MSKKKRLSEDAFSWVQKTTEKDEEPKPAKTSPAKKASSKPRKARAATEAAPQRFIFIEYDKNNGHIVATHEILRGAEDVSDESLTSDSKDKAAVKIPLTGELSDKEPIDIHINFKVVISKKKPKLVPRG